MGQYKMAVVLGLRHSDIPVPVLHEDEHGLLDRYDVAHPGHGIGSTVEPPDPVVGVVLAINADDVPGALCVGWEPVDLVGLLTGDRFRAAAEAWLKFSTWCGQNGTRLHAPKLLLALVEVG